MCCRVDCGEIGAIACSSGVQQGGVKAPSTFCLALRARLKHFREDLEGERVQASAYMGDIYLGPLGAKANTVRDTSSPRRELDDIGNVVNPTKIVALPPKRHAPTAEEVSLLEASTSALLKRKG